MSNFSSVYTFPSRGARFLRIIFSEAFRFSKAGWTLPLYLLIIVSLTSIFLKSFSRNSIDIVFNSCKNWVDLYVEIWLSRFLVCYFLSGFTELCRSETIFMFRCPTPSLILRSGKMNLESCSVMKMGSGLNVMTFNERFIVAFL